MSASSKKLASFLFAAGLFGALAACDPGPLVPDTPTPAPTSAPSATPTPRPALAQQTDTPTLPPVAALAQQRLEAVPITLGLTEENSLLAPEERRSYRFTVQDGGRYVVDLVAASPLLASYSFSVVAFNQSGGIGRRAVLGDRFTLLNVQGYTEVTVELMGQSGTSGERPFRLRIVPVELRELAAGERVSAAFPTDLPVGLYQFATGEAATVSIQASSDPAPLAALYLLDWPELTVLATGVGDAEAGTEPDIANFRLPDSGAYYLVVMGFPDAAGEYTLRLDVLG